MREAIITIIDTDYGDNGVAYSCTTIHRVEFEGRLIEGEDDIRLTKVVATERLVSDSHEAIDRDLRTEDGEEAYSRAEVEFFWHRWKAGHTDEVPATLVGIFSDPRISRD